MLQQETVRHIKHNKRKLEIDNLWLNTEQDAVETADFASGTAKWRYRPNNVNNVVRRSNGANTWRTGRNSRVVFDCGLFFAVCENTSSTKPEADNISHGRLRRTEP